MGTLEMPEEKPKRTSTKRKTHDEKPQGSSKKTDVADTTSSPREKRPKWARDLPAGEYAHLRSYANVLESIERRRRQLITHEQEGTDAMPILRLRRKPGQTKYMSREEVTAQIAHLEPFAMRIKAELEAEDSPQTKRDAVPLVEESVRRQVYQQMIVQPRSESRQMYDRYMSGYSAPPTATKNPPNSQ